MTGATGDPATAEATTITAPAPAPAPADPDDGRLARRAGGLLRAFNEAGILDAADVHVAGRLAALAQVDDPPVLLAAALAARAPRLGHVCVDLATIASTAGPDDGEPAPDLDWPEPSVWRTALRASPLVGDGRPLRLDGSRCYLDRLHAEECRVATALLQRAASPVGPLDDDQLDRRLLQLFPDDGAGDLQRAAAAVAVRRRLAVIAGGPGTGKTTTVARLLALLEEQAVAVGARPPLVALAAPTGKAAARLQEAVRGELARLDLPLPGAATRWTASTIHRLLGTRPDSSTRFRHDAAHPLVHDVVVVDEASMLSLSLMDRLLAAVRPDARLVLLGDPEQLASVEAGVVLGDLVGPPAGASGTADPSATAGGPATAGAPGVAGGPAVAGDRQAPTLAGSVVVLQRIHRFGAVIAELATAVRRGDGPRALDLLGAGDGELTWIPVAATEAAGEALAPLQAEAVGAWRAVAEHSADGDAGAALAGLGAFRVLCAHRLGPAGASGWNDRLERWLAEAGVGQDRRGGWWCGQPLLVTVNDYDLRLFNGDTGVVIGDAAGRLSAVFDRGDGIARLSPSRLAHVETCYAMTVHKSQGSQFDTVAVVLPDPGSRILTRELFYTGLTRAKQRVVVVGSPDSVVAAVERPIARASGLRDRLS